MSKAEEEANKRYGITRGDDTQDTSGIDMQRASDFIDGYRQAEEDLIDKTLFFLKDRLYKDGYVGIIDLCDDYIKAMKK